MLNISDVRVTLAGGGESDKLKAYCSITIDECFMVRGIKLIDGAKGMFLAMPNRKTQCACKHCKHRNPVSNHYCGKCGKRISIQGDSTLDEASKLERVDVAHPLNSECRQQILAALIEAFAQTERLGSTGNDELIAGPSDY